MPSVTRIQCGGGNCFCVEENGAAILIDTSRTEYRDKILSACRGRDVRLIVLTHGHVDHIQNAAALSKALQAPIAMHKDDVELIKNNMAQPVFADSLPGKLVLALSLKSFKYDKVERFEPDVILNDGDTLEAYGINAVIVGLPGHTEGSIGVLVGSGLFVGDALMNMFYPTKSLLYGDKDQMIKSAGKISACKHTTIHFGHGKSMANRVW